MFPSARELVSKPCETASFGLYLDYYTTRADLTQNKLAVCARINQSRLNKIANGGIKDISVDTLVCLCLSLRLREEEVADFLARKERAFSPANPVHRHYLDLIRIYPKKQSNYNISAQELSAVLSEADDYLKEHNCAALPSCDADK